MNASQLFTTTVYLLITIALGYLAFIWAWPLIVQGALFGGMAACFLVWVIWCVVKP